MSGADEKSSVRSNKDKKSQREQKKKSKSDKKESKKISTPVVDDAFIEEYLNTEFDNIDEYDIELQGEIVSTLLKYKIFHKDVYKYWRIKCNQIKMAIYRGYKIPINELQLLEMSEIVDDSEDMDQSKNLIYFYAFIAHRWDYILYNIYDNMEPSSFKILFYQTYLSCMYTPAESLGTVQSDYYKIKVKTIPNKILYIHYTNGFTQEYIINLAFNLQYYNDKYDTYSCSIISDNKPTKVDMQKINDYKKILDDSNSDDNPVSANKIFFSFMNTSEFILDVFSHILNPEINMIDSEFKGDLLVRENASGDKFKRYTPEQLPQILRTDIVSRYLNMRLGNIITIDNVNLVFESITPASRTVRVCTNTDIIKTMR